MATSLRLHPVGWKVYQSPATSTLRSSKNGVGRRHCLDGGLFWSVVPPFGRQVATTCEQSGAKKRQGCPALSSPWTTPLVSLRADTWNRPSASSGAALLSRKLGGRRRVLFRAVKAVAPGEREAEDPGGSEGDGWDDDDEGWDDEGEWEYGEFEEDDGEWADAEWEDEDDDEESEVVQAADKEEGAQETQTGGQDPLASIAIDYSVPLEEEGWPAVAARVGQMDKDTLVRWLEEQPDWEAVLWRLVNVPPAEAQWPRQEAVRQRRQWVSHAEEGALAAAGSAELARDVAEEAVQDLAAGAQRADNPALEYMAEALRHVADRRAQSSLGRLIAGTQAVLAVESNKTVAQQLSYYYRGLPEWVESEVSPRALGPVARQVAAVAQRVQQEMDTLCAAMELELRTAAQEVYSELRLAGEEGLADRVGFHLLGGVEEAKQAYAEHKAERRRQLARAVRLEELAAIDAGKGLQRAYQEDARDVSHGILSRRDLEMRKAFMTLEEDEVAPKQKKPATQEDDDAADAELALTAGPLPSPPAPAVSQFDPYALFAVRGAQAGLLPPLKHSDGTVLVSEAARARAFQPSLKQLRLEREVEKKKAMGIEYFTSGAASGHHVGPQGGRVFPADDSWRPSLGPLSVDEEVDVLAAYLSKQSEKDYLHMKGADIQINRDPITWDMTWADINQYFDGDSRIEIDNLINTPDEKLSFAGPEWERPQSAWEFIHTIGRLLPPQPDVSETVEYRSVPKWEKEWGQNPPPMLTPEDEPLAVPAAEEETGGEAAALELAEDVGDELEDELELELPKGAFADDEDAGGAGDASGQGVDVKKLLKGAKKEFSPRKGSTDALDRLNIKSLPDDLELLASEDEDFQ